MVPKLLNVFMEIRDGEVILKVFHHHVTPFIFWLFKILFVFTFLFGFLYLFQNIFNTMLFIIFHVLLVAAFGIIMFYKSVVYWMDKLYVTNQRIIYVNWTSVFMRKESEAMLDDIQDIRTQEKGFVSYISMFDYGLFTLETSAANVTLEFDKAPDPEGIRQYIYHVRPQ